MTEEAQLSKALNDLAEGKFSFQMVDCITQSIESQKKEIEELRQFREVATADLAQQSRKISLLETALKAANTTIFALTKSNALVQEIIGATKLGFAKFNEIVVPKILQLAHEAKPYIIGAYKYSYAAVLKAILKTEPQVRAWLGSSEVSRNELEKTPPQSSAESHS